MPSSSWSWCIRATGRPLRERRPALRLGVEPLEERTMPDAAAIPVLTEAEPNDLPFLAMPIPTGAVVLGSVSLPADVDYYSFSVTEPGAITVAVEPRGASSLDAQLELDGVSSYLVLNNERSSVFVRADGEVAHSVALGDELKQFLASALARNCEAVYWKFKRALG